MGGLQPLSALSAYRDPHIPKTSSHAALLAPEVSEFRSQCRDDVSELK